MSAPREAMVPLTRWQYFTKTLYHNAAATSRFAYNKIIYEKSEELQDIEQRSSKINAVLLLLLMLMFYLTSRYQNVWIVIAYLLLAVIGQVARVLLLPKDIKAHLTDTNLRER